MVRGAAIWYAGPAEASYRHSMRPYMRLRVWQMAHGLALEVARTTDGFPIHERYGLTAQLRRAALSVPANVVEGRGRRGSREFLRFVTIATGSADELDYLLLYARDRGYLSNEDHDRMANDVWGVRGMLLRLGQGLRNRIRQEDADR